MMKHTKVPEELSCLKEIKEEAMEELEEAGQNGGEAKCHGGQQASQGPLYLGDTAHLSIDGMGIVLFSAEVMGGIGEAL